MKVLLSLVSLTYVLIAASVLPSLGLAQEKQVFEYKYEDGKTYRYTDSLKARITQEMMGREMTITANARVVMRYVVKTVNSDGSIQLVYSADSMVVASKSPMRDTTLVMKDMIGKRSSVRLSKDGVVTQKKTIDSISNEARMMGMSAVTSAPHFARFATRAIGAGDKWTSTVTDSTTTPTMSTQSTINYEYTAGGVEQKLGHTCRVITYTGSGTISGKGSMQGMDLFVDGTSKVKGTMHFDVALGIVVVEDQKMENESTIAATGAQQMTIPQSSVFTHTHILRGE